MSEDSSFDLSTAARYVLFIADRSCRKIAVSTSQLHYFMLLCTCSTPGARERTPSNTNVTSTQLNYADALPRRNKI